MSWPAAASWSTVWRILVTTPSTDGSQVSVISAMRMRSAVIGGVRNPELRSSFRAPARRQPDDLGVDQLPVIGGCRQQVVDDSVGEQLRLEAEIEQPSIRSPVVVLVELDPRVGKMVDVCAASSRHALSQ